MKNDDTVLKIAISAVASIALFSTIFIVSNIVGYEVAANEVTYVRLITQEIVIPDELLPEEFPMPEVIVVTPMIPVFSEHSADELGAMSLEQAILEGAIYIFEMFGTRIDGMMIEMEYVVSPPGLEDADGFANWVGIVSDFDEVLIDFIERDNSEMNVDVRSNYFLRQQEARRFYFSINAVTGARNSIGLPYIYQKDIQQPIFFPENYDDPEEVIQPITNEEILASHNLWHYSQYSGTANPFYLEMPDEEMLFFTRLAEDFTSRHFRFSDEYETSFIGSEPIEFQRNDYGIIEATDFMLTFEVFSQTGFGTSVRFIRSLQQLYNLHTILVPYVPIPIQSPVTVSPSPPLTYTVAQVSTAIRDVLNAVETEGTPQIIAVQRVSLPGNRIWHEPSSSFVDVSGLLRYRVLLQYTQTQEEYEHLITLFPYDGTGVRRIWREGDNTFHVRHFYFRDSGGNPILVVAGG